MTVRINLNEKVKVRLTDHGKDIYYHRYDNLYERLTRSGRLTAKPFEPSYPKVDEDGYTEFQLWEFIELYGPHIGMGRKSVMQPLEIVYEESED